MIFKELMKRVLKIFFVSFIGISATFAEPFEGTIKLVKQTYYDTFYYDYHVKEHLVRIDMFSKDSSILSSLIVDTKKRKVFAINSDRKLFKELKVNNDTSGTEAKDYRILKTENSKVIDGYLCYQWRVRSKNKNSEVVYWVTKNGFYFYDDLVNILNNVDNISDFYKHISDSEGFLPILIVERTLVRYEKERLQVSAINYTSLDKNIFTIPVDYKKFEN